MNECRAEFIVEPFVEGDPGPHVVAAIAAAERGGLVADVGPFGTTIAGDCQTVMQAIQDLVVESTAAGATRLSIQLTVVAG